MNFITRAFALSIAFSLVVLASTGCISVNKDISVADGEQIEENLTTVNGSIRVGSDARVGGDLETVNGSIEIGTGSEVQSLDTVNGSITISRGASVGSADTVNGGIDIGEDVQVEGDVDTVNGQITLAQGTVVQGKVASVNGKLTLSGAEAGSLENINGGMLLNANSVVNGELRVGRARSRNDKPVLVEIHEGSRVVGPLVFERAVTLRIHETAEVGEIEGAEPEYFSD